MIRRGFWFAAGAVAGIAGYRRASRAVRALLPHADLLAPAGRRIAAQTARRALGPGAGRPGANQKTAARTAAFVRDVRAGMTDYLDQHRGI